MMNGSEEAKRVICTKIFLEGKDEFVQGMNEITAAMRRAEDAAKALNRALSNIAIRSD